MTAATPTESRVIRRTLTRDMPNGSRVVAEIEVRIAAEGEQFVNGLSPAFSVTGSVWEARGSQSGAARERRYRRMLTDGRNPGPASEPDVSGCVHEEIARAFPELAQVIRMHLSDPITGEPMHAEANGWYWYLGSRPDLVRLERECGTVAVYHGGNGIYSHQLAAYDLPDDDDGHKQYCYLTACRILRVPSIPGEIANREDFARFVDAQRDRWRREAAEALAFIEALPED
jgi:hypothetical protein